MSQYYRIPEDMRSRYVSWKSDSVYGRKEWLRRALEAEAYYYHDVEGTGTTFTLQQLDNIRKHTDIPVSVNFIHPICNQKLAILAQVKPSSRILSMDGRAQQYAYVLDKIKQGIFYTSNINMEIENMIKDMLISGMGHIVVNPANAGQPSLFNLRVNHVPYDEVILDVNAKKINLEDMEGFFIEREFTIAKFMQLYSGLMVDLTSPEGLPADIQAFVGQVWIEGEKTDKQQVITTTWNQSYRITVREYYEKVFTTAFLVPNPETGVIEYIFEENLTLDQLPILSMAQGVKKGTFIRKHLIFGDFVVWSAIIPIQEYPIVTSFFEWGGKPYRSYGMIHFFKNNQDAYDKILQIMVLNGILSNNAGWNTPKGSIADEDRAKWEDYANNPRVVKEYIPVVREGQVLKPEKDQVGQLSNFYPMVLEMIMHGMEYTSGVSAILQGNAKEANIEVFSSLQQYQNAAMMRVILSTNHINETIKQLSEVLIQYIISSITPDSYYYLDEKAEINELQVTLEAANELKKYRYLLVAIPATSMPTQRLAIGSELMKIAQSSPDPAERQILTVKALQLSEIREYEDIVKQLDQVKNLQGQMTQLQEAYNRLLETSKQMENKYINVTLENRLLNQLGEAQTKIASDAAQATTEISMAKELAKAKIQGKQQVQK